MALGLGMRPDEWTELLGQVDDSFWVMRIIGKSSSIPILLLYPEIDNLQDIRLYRVVTMVFLAVLTS